MLLERANRHAADVASTVKSLQAAGVTSLAAKRPQTLRGVQLARHSDRERTMDVASRAGVAGVGAIGLTG